MSESDDLKAHEEMWRNFVKMVVFAAGTAIVCLVLLAIFLL